MTQFHTQQLTPCTSCAVKIETHLAPHPGDCGWTHLAVMLSCYAWDSSMEGSRGCIQFTMRCSTQCGAVPPVRDKIGEGKSACSMPVSAAAAGLPHSTSRIMLRTCGIKSTLAQAASDWPSAASSENLSVVREFNRIYYGHACCTCGIFRSSADVVV